MMNQPSPRRVASRSTPAPGPAHITEGLEQPTPVKEVSVRKASRVVLPITPGEVKDASLTKQRASRRVSTNSTTPVAAIVSTPRSVVIMRADRAVIDTPIAKKIIIEPSVSAVAIRKANVSSFL